MSALDVLLVDDEEDLVTALVERLEIRGFSAEGVGSAAAALERLREGPVRVVVADVKMPGMGGIELTRQIRDRHPGTEVVLLTGHGSERDSRCGLALGALAYLAKPVRIEELVGTLRRAAGGGP